MQSEREFQQWCWRRARLVFAPIFLICILETVFQNTFYSFIWYTLFSTLDPLVWIFQVPLILSFIVMYIIIWRKEVFKFTSTAYIVLYALLFLFTLLFGILLFAIPNHLSVGFFAISSFLTAAPLLVFALQIVYYNHRKKQVGMASWTPSKSFLFIATVSFFLFDLFLGFIYHPDVFTVVTFHFGIFGSHIFFEFCAEIALFFICFIHFVWYIRQPSYLTAIGIDPKTQPKAAPLTTPKLAYMYAWPLLFYALGHIFSITLPPIHCTNVFSPWTSDICVPSVLLGSWSFICGLALLPLPLRMLRRYRPSNRAALAQMVEQGDVSVEGAEAGVYANPAPAAARPLGQPPADAMTWVAPAPTATAGEQQPLTASSPVPASKHPVGTCCAWTWIVIAAILLPLVVLVIVIGTFPFQYYWVPGDTSPTGHWQYHEMTLIKGIDMNASLDVCDTSLGPAFSSMFLYVLRDQNMTAEQTARFVSLFNRFMARPESNNSFDRWVALWAMTDVYKLAPPAHKPLVQDAWNFTLAESQKMGWLPKMIAEDTKIWLGDGDALVKLFARNAIIAPGNRLFRQGPEPRFSHAPTVPVIYP